MIGNRGGASLITIGLLAIGLAVGIYLINNPQVLKSRADFNPLVNTDNVTLSLNPTQGTANRGCDFSLNVNLDLADKESIGTDVILKYDRSRLEAVSVEKTDYELTGVDISEDKIRFSVLILNHQVALKGKKTIAKVTLRTLKTAPDGLAHVVFDFDASNKANTIDSNVVQSDPVEELLDNVEDGLFVIGDNSCKLI